MNNLTLTIGKGSAKNNTACLMSAARIFSGEAKLSDPRGDNCSRVCPSIRVVAIALNDLLCWESDSQRTQELLPLVPMLLDTKPLSYDVITKRNYLLASYAVHSFARIFLDKTDPVLADKIGKLSPITDSASRIAADMAMHGLDTVGHHSLIFYLAKSSLRCITDGSTRCASYATEAAASVVPYNSEKVKQAMISLLKQLCAIK